MLNPYSGRYALVRGNFTEMGAILTALGRKKVNGILLDLGMSFLQLADSQRGFSFLHNGPLDMRMDRRRGLMADQIINRWPQKQLKEVIKEYGEEKWAGRLARKIVETRIKTPITTTAQLCEIITKTISRRYWGSHLHPATRTFQALRLAVNDELKNLKQFLEGALDLLTSKGRLVIICFHSLEDRLVKVSFRKWAKEGKVQLLTKKPIGPLKEEIAINPKARSAKLRSIERI
jgi:16S rRNA (cytosine1402-N4)-methyltransferase